MPNYGIEIVEGIPVFLKDGLLHAFQIENLAYKSALKLGSVNANNKIDWSSKEELESWLQTYRQSLTSKMRK
jgi:hypothetical protein